MTEIRQTIIDNIKIVCKLKKIKNIDLANHLGVSQGSISNWFKGSNSIDIDNLYEICRFLGVSLDQIFGIEQIHPEIILNNNEIDLITAYRNAEPSAREIALETLKNHQKKTVEETAI